MRGDEIASGMIFGIVSPEEDAATLVVVAGVARHRRLTMIALYGFCRSLGVPPSRNPEAWSPVPRLVPEAADYCLLVSGCDEDFESLEYVTTVDSLDGGVTDWPSPWFRHNGAVVYYDFDPTRTDNIFERINEVPSVSSGVVQTWPYRETNATHVDRTVAVLCPDRGAAECREQEPLF